jgi:pseudaminic acid synthase
MNIGGIEIGAGLPCRFVAEISNNHNGSLVQAFRLIEAAKNAGADFVKFQCFTVDELVELRGDGPAPEPWGSQGWTMRTLYEKAQTPLSWFPMLFQRARDVGLVPFSSVFGMESLACLKAVGNPLYKIARLDYDADQMWLVDSARNTGEKVIISSSRNYKPEASDILLYCPVGYPTPDDEVWLPNFNDEECQFIGLSSHNLNPLLPVAAVARGCQLIEMHLQLDDELSELESEVSLTASDFATYISLVRETEAMI